MSFAPRIEGVKGVVPTPLKGAIKAGGRAVYYAPPRGVSPLGVIGSRTTRDGSRNPGTSSCAT